MSIDSEDVNFVIVPSAYVKYYENYTPIYQLTAEGKSKFQYVIVSLEAAWDQSKIAEGTAGVINTIGRDKTKFLVEELLASKKFKRVKQVSKLPDLYPLLALGNAQYAIFAPRDLEQVKEEFSSKPIQVVKTIEVPYPLVCIKKNSNAKAAEIFTKIKAETFRSIGMDGVKALDK